MGRRAHYDVVIELEKKFSRPPNPDELFMVAHKKKNGQWVGRDAENTHDDYVNRLTQATQNDNNVNGSEKLQLWKEVVGGKANENAREAMAETAELKRKFEEFQK
ncbi:hypothetical protein RYX36_003539 [Vicia faba]